MRRAPFVLLAGVLAVLPVLSACSDDGSAAAGPDVPPVEAFAEGTCRAAAEDVRTIGRLLPQLGEGPEVEPEVLDALKDSQEPLRRLEEGAEPEYQKPLEELTVAVGFVRIRGISNTYEPFLGETAEQAYERVVAACTGDGAPAAG